MYEFLYIKALRAAETIKKIYFRKTLERFNRGLLKTLGDGSRTGDGSRSSDGKLTGDGCWSSEDREREYREIVLPYWRKFGYRPKKFWFELNCSREKHMDPRFIPSDLYYNELLPYINNLPFRYALQDKCSLDLRFPEVKQAVTVCRRMAGVYYDPEMNVTDQDKAVRLCLSRDADLFIKPSVYTSAGVGIRKFTPSECSEENIKALLEETGANFIVQEMIRQSDAVKAINPDSVSTIRVVSLFIDSKVYIAHSMLRVGAPGMPHVATDGGYSVEILDDGHLFPMAYRDKGAWVSGKECNLYDDSTVIPGMDKVRKAVCLLHPKLPYFKWIGWDFAINESGDPVMIEFNTSPGDDIQRVCGSPLFGDMTDRILDDYFISRAMEHDQLSGLWCGSEKLRRY